MTNIKAFLVIILISSATKVIEETSTYFSFSWFVSGKTVSRPSSGRFLSILTNSCVIRKFLNSKLEENFILKTKALEVWREKILRAPMVSFVARGICHKILTLSAFYLHMSSPLSWLKSWPSPTPSIIIIVQLTWKT